MTDWVDVAAAVFLGLALIGAACVGAVLVGLGTMAVRAAARLGRRVVGR